MDVCSSFLDITTNDDSSFEAHRQLPFMHHVVYGLVLHKLCDRPEGLISGQAALNLPPSATHGRQLRGADTLQALPLVRIPGHRLGSSTFDRWLRVWLPSTYRRLIVGAPWGFHSRNVCI